MLDKILQGLGDNFISALKEEFDTQNHSATGAAMDSFRAEVVEFEGSHKVLIWGAFYVEYVNRGRKPNEKPIPFDAILEWVKVRNIAQGEDAKRAAWAIIRTIVKEGSPTAGAYKHSKNGRRKNFIEHIKENKLQQLLADYRNKLVEEMGHGLLNTAIFNGTN